VLEASLFAFWPAAVAQPVRGKRRAEAAAEA
jgi:hypothetical protein